MFVKHKFTDKQQIPKMAKITRMNALIPVQRFVKRNANVHYESLNIYYFVMNDVVVFFNITDVKVKRFNTNKRSHNKDYSFEISKL